MFVEVFFRDERKGLYTAVVDSQSSSIESRRQGRRRCSETLTFVSALLPGLVGLGGWGLLVHRTTHSKDCLLVPIHQTPLCTNANSKAWAL